MEVLSSASDKVGLFAKKFSRNLIVMSQVSLCLFSLVELIWKLVKKVITNLDLAKAFGPDCIPVVDLKNWEPELSYILADLFNMCLKESCFPDCWRVLSVISVFKNVEERSTAKNYRPLSLLSVVGKE